MHTDVSYFRFRFLNIRADLCPKISSKFDAVNDAYCQRFTCAGCLHIDGPVQVGSEEAALKAGYFVSGRLYGKVIQDFLELVDLCILNANVQGLIPLFARNTPALSHHSVIHRSWILCKSRVDDLAHGGSVPELVCPDKARSISNRSALQWQEIDIAAESDCREILDELAGPKNDYDLAF
jgi:hypothetical protein